MLLEKASVSKVEFIAKLSLIRGKAVVKVKRALISPQVLVKYSPVELLALKYWDATTLLQLTLRGQAIAYRHVIYDTKRQSYKRLSALEGDTKWYYPTVHYLDRRSLLYQMNDKLAVFNLCNLEVEFSVIQ